MEEQKKKKIIYIITKASWGGAQRYVFDLVQYFSKTAEVIVVCGANEFGGENIFKNKLKNEGICTIELLTLRRDVNLFDDAQTFLALVKLFHIEKPNIVHLNSSKIGLLGALAGRMYNTCRKMRSIFRHGTTNNQSQTTNLIYTAHGLPFLEVRPHWQNVLIKIATWITFVLSHKVIVLSKFEENLVKNWWFTKNKIHQIYNGIECPDFLLRAQARAELAKMANILITDNTFIVGSIAELTPNKGLLEFLPELTKLKELVEKEGKEFAYIHFGTGELEKELKVRTAELNIIDNVSWLGFVPDANKYLKALDLFTLPSKKEGLPYVLLEAKMAGIKIEANKVGGVREILHNSISEFRIENMLEKTNIVYSL